MEDWRQSISPELRLEREPSVHVVGLKELTHSGKSVPDTPLPSRGIGKLAHRHALDTWHRTCLNYPDFRIGSDSYRTFAHTVTADAGPAMSDKNLVPSRTFTSQSGRRWTASLAAAPVRSGTAVVLRFVSDGLLVDLERWPADWETFPDDDLVLLLRRAQPPHLGLPDAQTAPQRAGGR